MKLKGNKVHKKYWREQEEENSGLQSFPLLPGTSDYFRIINTMIQRTTKITDGFIGKLFFI